MKYTLGISPCPNDTFIFDALIHHKIDTQQLSFEVVLADVEQLNTWALAGKLDITKLSYGVYPLVQHQYTLLQSGSALGRGVGPLLVCSPQSLEKWQHDSSACVVAIPGVHTTAHRLFSLFYPQVTQKQFLVFSDIEQAVLSGQVDAGVIIHEGRFTYADRGLIKLADLGDVWETTYNIPIPLGGIVCKQTMPQPHIVLIEELIRQSVQYAWQQYPQLSLFVQQHAQEMSEEVMRNHILLYVNEYTNHLTAEGLQAINQLSQQTSIIHQ